MVGYSETEEWLEVDWILSQFSKQKKRAVDKYKQFVDDGIGDSSPLEKLQGQLVLGNDEFVTRAFSKLPKEKQKDLSEIPKKQRRKIDALSTYFKSKGQNKAIAEAYCSGGYSQKEIAKYLGCHYSTVSQKLKAYERQLKTWPHKFLNLDKTTLRVSANFFEVGGHSLLASRVVAQINERWKLNLTGVIIFESPTLIELAIVVQLELDVQQALSLFTSIKSKEEILI